MSAAQRNRRRTRSLGTAGAVVAMLLPLGVARDAPAAAAPAAPSLQVTPRDGDDAQQPSLARDPLRAGHLAIGYAVSSRAGSVPGRPFPDQELRSCGLARSSDGGATWQSTALIGWRAAFAVPEHFAACWNPVVAFSPDGTLYYVAQASLAPSNPYSHIIVAASRDGGVHFDPPQPADLGTPTYPGQRAGGDWWPSAAVDGRSGAVYVAWARFTPAPDTSAIQLTSSTDGARHFSPPVTVSARDQADVTDPMVAVGAGGAVHVSWLDYSGWGTGDQQTCSECAAEHLDEYRAMLDSFYRTGGARLDYTQGMGCGSATISSQDNGRGGDCSLPGQLHTATSVDGGASLMPGTAPGNGVPLGCPVEDVERSGHLCDPLHYSFFDHNLQSLAVDGSPGALALAWWDPGNERSTLLPGTQRLTVSLSRDGGSTWLAHATVGIPNGREQDQQHRPSLAVSRHGRLDLVYYDVAPDGSQDVYWTWSTDRGESFSSPLRLSERSSDTRVGPVSDDGRVSFGDHLAVLSTDDGVMAAWTDASSGSSRQTIRFTTRGTERQEGSSRSSGPSPASLIAPLAAVVVIGIGIRLASRRRRSWARDRTHVHGNGD